MSLVEICQAMGLPVPAGDESLMVSGASMDSRAVRPGDLFVCIAGERVDGHDFAPAAVNAGAVAVLAARPLDMPVPVLVAEDTVKALGALAHAWRKRFTGKVVAVTGSAGKTTVKEVLAQVLAVRGPTARNAMNLNNQIGMPLSLLATTGEEMFWVMEAGISQAHDMEELASILEPDVALVLNAGGAHAEGLGARGVAFHKAQLLAHVRPGGTGLACADYADLAREARAVCPQTLFFSSEGRPLAYRAAYSGAAPGGAAPGGAVRQAPQTGAVGEAAEAVQTPINGRGLYRLWLDGHPLDVEAPFRGAYGAENAIAIAATAHVLGLTGQEIARGFVDAALPRQRFQARSVGAWRIIDDTYNANPLSMARMLDAALDMAGGAPLYAVLGAMGELGASAGREHEKLGRLLARARVKALFWRGGHLEDVRAGLMAEGWKGTVYPADAVEEFLTAWSACRPRGGVVLFKGSRSNKLEELVEALAACEEVNDVL